MNYSKVNRSAQFSFDSIAGAAADSEPTGWEVFWRKQTWSFVASGDQTILEFLALTTPPRSPERQSTTSSCSTVAWRISTVMSIATERSTRPT